MRDEVNPRVPELKKYWLKASVTPIAVLIVLALGWLILKTYGG